MHPFLFSINYSGFKPSQKAIVQAAEEDAGATARVATLKTVNCGGTPISADLIACFTASRACSPA
jgi:hypothetical protein